MGYFNTGTRRLTNTVPMVCDLVRSCQMQIFVCMQFYAGFLRCIPFWRDVNTLEGGVGVGMMGKYVTYQYQLDFHPGILSFSLEVFWKVFCLPV